MQKYYVFIIYNVYIDDTRTLHELNRGMKKIKSEIDIPEIDIEF